MCFKTYLNHPIKKKTSQKKQPKAITVLKKEGGSGGRLGDSAQCGRDQEVGRKKVLVKWLLHRFRGLSRSSVGWLPHGIFNSYSFFLHGGLGGQIHNWKSHSDFFAFKKSFFLKHLEIRYLIWRYAELNRLLVGTCLFSLNIELKQDDCTVCCNHTDVGNVLIGIKPSTLYFPPPYGFTDM